MLTKRFITFAIYYKILSYLFGPLDIISGSIVSANSPVL